MIFVSGFAHAKVFLVKVDAFQTMTVDQMWIADMIQKNLKGTAVIRPEFKFPAKIEIAFSQILFIRG